MSARFALVKNPGAMARDFLPPEKRPAAYGYPAKRSSLRYAGLGKDERDLYDALSPEANDEAIALVDRVDEGKMALSDVFADLTLVRLFASAFDDADEYDLLFLVPEGEAAAIPAGFRLLGYDVAYPLGDELFSAVSDLFFYPLWHGADPAGKAYAAEFALLNKSGLFDDPGAAAAFRDRYVSDFDEDDLYVTSVYIGEI